jgi:hypothetical protein
MDNSLLLLARKQSPTIPFCSKYKLNVGLKILKKNEKIKKKSCKKIQAQK